MLSNHVILIYLKLKSVTHSIYSMFQPLSPVGLSQEPLLVTSGEVMPLFLAHPGDTDVLIHSEAQDLIILRGGQIVVLEKRPIDPDFEDRVMLWVVAKNVE